MTRREREKGRVRKKMLAALSLYHLKHAKRRWHLENLTQVHHIIPLEFRQREVLADYDMDTGHNLMLMPNKEGKEVLRTDRAVHDGGHPFYNVYVGSRLRQLEKVNGRERQERVRLLAAELRARIRENDVPWN